MQTYQVMETQNVQSTRAPLIIEARDLSDAKRKASRMQMFKGTVLTISAANGAILAVKESGVWRNA